MRGFYLFGLVSITLLAVGVSGCGQPKAKIAGAVSLSEKPVVVGTVSLMSELGQPFQGEIQPDGKFVVPGVPYGNYRAIVRQPRATPPDGEAPPVDVKPRRRPDIKPAPGWLPIPERYTQYDQSGLSLTVDSPAVNFDIKLSE